MVDNKRILPADKWAKELISFLKLRERYGTETPLPYDLCKQIYFEIWERFYDAPIEVLAKIMIYGKGVRRVADGKPSKRKKELPGPFLTQLVDEEIFVGDEDGLSIMRRTAVLTLIAWIHKNLSEPPPLKRTPRPSGGVRDLGRRNRRKK